MRIIYPPQIKKITSKIVRVPYKTGETAVLKVTENSKGDFVEISGKVMHKGKEVGKVNYHNQKGFSDQRLLDIIFELEQKAKEGFDFFKELLTKAE